MEKRESTEAKNAQDTVIELSVAGRSVWKGIVPRQPEKTATEEPKPTLTDVLLSRDGGSAVMHGDEIIVYKKHGDGSLTEVYRGDLFRVLQIVFLGPPGREPGY